MVLSFTGVMKMKMNLSKRILVALLSCLLVQFTAQAGSYTSASESGQQPQGPAAGQTPQELQQLVAPIALYPDDRSDKLLQLLRGLPRESCSNLTLRSPCTQTHSLRRFSPPPPI